MVIFGHIQLLTDKQPFVRSFEMWVTEDGQIQGRVPPDITSRAANGIEVLTALVERVAAEADKWPGDFGVRLIDENDDRVNVRYDQIFALKEIARLVADR